MIKVEIEKLEGLVPRMLELTSRNTPWHRRNWRASTLELVEETLSESRIPGIREGALSEMHEHLSNSLKNDPGVPRAHLKFLMQCVKNISSSNEDTSHDVCLAAHYAQDLRQIYLQNWADLFEDPEKAGKLDVEGTAKRIISHLLYCKVPASSIYKVIYDRKNAAAECDFSSLLRELDSKTKSEIKDFKFAVLVDRTPSFLYSSAPLSQWLTPRQMKQWKHENAPHAENVRQHGGFILTVQARDVNEAASEAQKLLPQLSFKFQSGSENQFSILPIMWSKEKGRAFPTHRGARSLKLHAFQRANALHHLEIASKARNILAIIEPLQTQDSHVAIVNGWVAIESLLVDATEQDRLGAERMARIVAASYFRTEMTWLARNYSEAYKEECPLARQIRDSEQSIDRSRLMAKIILEKNHFERLDQPDQLAINKMREALEKPNSVFQRTCEILKREFQRMYRKRNLIVHSGRAVENGIESVADKVIPLLINGIDQLLIANIQHNLDPKTLAASVEFKSRHLEQVGNSKSYSILDLLEVD
ncbi:hypothetical protein [Corynebacterium kozikiae]|uniref:hypothetical protein n=1 Tax=Corynebacterium kozikiae TaxID=2968469 RepID=UPI00211C06BE|nr:hypothetical protein [Corynebacterium sp. 76QC2CO]MCQ9343695.1 hypothetical protein [Corynebacterium sp. 76QC2CO]